MSELKILNLPSPQISERLRLEEEGGSRFLLATTSLTTAGKQGKQIFPSILRRPWRSLQGSFSKWSFPFQTFLLRCSFDESHRQPIFLLGGIPALAELIQVTEKKLIQVANQRNMECDKNCQNAINGPKMMIWSWVMHMGGLCIGRVTDGRLPSSSPTATPSQPSPTS